MLINEIEKKIKEKTATEQDLFDYFKVKNIEGLEMYLYERFKEEKHNNEYLLSGFKSIFNDLNYETYNPLQEEYMFYFIVTKGIYDFSSDEYNLLIDILGVFKTLQIMRAALEDKDAVKFYRELYKNYLEKTFNMNLVINAGIDKMLKYANSLFVKMGEEDTKKMFGDLIKELKSVDFKGMLDSLPKNDTKNN
jgi:hypothetical protein